MIIHFFVSIFAISMALCGIIIFLCISLLGLACLDYLCDSDIKGELTKNLGHRPILKKIRQRVELFIEKHDGPTKEDVMFSTMDQYRNYIRTGKVEAVKEDEEFDEEVHKVLEGLIFPPEEEKEHKS